MPTNPSWSGQRSSPEERLATLEAIFANFREIEGQHHKEYTMRLDMILAQTTQTNGRVDKLESLSDKIKGGWIVIGAFATGLGWIAHEIASHLWK